jgi:hypothetical protein
VYVGLLCSNRTRECAKGGVIHNLPTAATYPQAQDQLPTDFRHLSTAPQKLSLVINNPVVKLVYGVDGHAPAAQ